MSARQQINRILTRATGYHLTKGAPGAGRGPNTPATQRDIAAIRVELQTALGRIEAAARPKAPPKAPKVETFPKDFDDDFVATIKAVRPYTMTSADKLHALITAVHYIARYDIPGDIVECGVWRGGSMHAVARTLDQVGRHDRELYLYDTFEGMTTPTENDRRYDGSSAAASLERSDRSSMVWAYASLEDVQAGFETVPYPRERLHFVKGPIEQTVPATLPEQISILRLDTDWYESTAHELTCMYDRLVPGGVLMIDDYGYWQGSRKATDEFLDKTGEQLLLVRMGTGRVAVKR